MKTRKNFRIENELLKKAQEQAEIMHISLTELVETSLASFINEPNPEQNIKVLDGLTLKEYKHLNRIFIEDREPEEQGELLVLKFRHH